MKVVFVFLLTFSFGVNSYAQNFNEIVHQGELGFTVGTANYYGDINTSGSINRLKPAFGMYFRKHLGGYIGARIAAHFAQLGYSDTYSKNEYQQLRNLSFNTNIWEISVQGDFNFFKFVPGVPGYSFTPYVTLGIGAFGYDPYAYIGGQKTFLRPLGTEGQNIGYQGRKSYKNIALAFPIGVGLKYNISEKLNLTIELAHRITSTDYLDDVSTTFVGNDKFAVGSPSFLLQDRSYEFQPTNVLGVEGRQRGFSKQKDQYLFFEVGLSFNFLGYRCPTAD